MVGVDEIRTGTTAFFATIAGLHHEVVNEWNVNDDSIVELKVTYDRKDGQQVTIPCVAIFHTDAAGKIDALPDVVLRFPWSTNARHRP